MAGLLAAVGVAIGIFKMPASAALAAAALRRLLRLLPIGWIVLAAVFLYHLTVRTGQFDVVKRSVAAISPDRRMQALLIAFSFGTFLEGAAGFGTPVAISAALLIGLGFSPLYAAGLALLANTSPVAFGALGTPIITLAKVSGINEMALSQMAGRQLPLFSLIMPAWLVAMMSGWKGVKGCWPAILVCGGSFAAIQFVTVQLARPGAGRRRRRHRSLVVLTVFLRFWQPKEIWRFAEKGRRKRTTKNTTVRSGTETIGSTKYEAWKASGEEGHDPCPGPSLARLAKSPTPGCPGCCSRSWCSSGAGRRGRTFLNGGTAETAELPGRHRQGVVRGAVAAQPRLSHRAGGRRAAGQRTAPNGPKPAIYEFNWLSATGTGIFLAAVLSAFWLRISPARLLRASSPARCSASAGPC